MDVLLDSNVIRGHRLGGPGLSSLREYLLRTKSRLLLPSVVVEELCAQKRIEVAQVLQSVNKAKTDLERLIPEFSVDLPRVDLEAVVEDYKAQLYTLAERVEKIDNAPPDLKELVRRLANRVPPASPSGEEARDVLIWLSVLTLGRKQELAFVSRDKKAFFVENRLKDELEGELKSLPFTVVASAGLDAFLKAYSQRSSWISKAWVEEQMVSHEVVEAIREFLEGREELLLRRYIDDTASLTGVASLLQIAQTEVQDFFVSDTASDALLVGVSLWAELEIEFEFQSRMHDWLDWRPEPTLNSKVVYPTIVAHLELEVIGREVKFVSVTDIERS